MDTVRSSNILQPILQEMEWYLQWRDHFLLTTGVEMRGLNLTRLACPTFCKNFSLHAAARD
jgi:hypothetical protein